MTRLPTAYYEPGLSLDRMDDHSPWLTGTGELGGLLCRSCGPSGPRGPIHSADCLSAVMQAENEARWQAQGIDIHAPEPDWAESLDLTSEYFNPGGESGGMWP